MDLLVLFLAPSNLPFAISLSLMVGIALVEVASMLLGLGISELVDNAIGFDTDVDIDVDVDIDIDIDGDVSFDLDADHDYDGFIDMEHGIVANIFGWLQLGKVPILILFSVFLASFGLIGLFGQVIAVAILGVPVSAFLAGPLAFIIALPLTRIVGKWFGKIMPKEETSAIKVESLVGSTAKITIGTATYTRAAEARVTDQYGTTHYVRVAPLNEGEEISSGTEVLLVEKDGNTFRVTAR